MISSTDRVRNEEVLHGVKEEMCILYIYIYIYIYIGTRCWWRSWLRHRATSRKVAGSIPDGVIGIFH